jgi:uncharacterized repeat protein (TIGR03803 family)
MKFAGTRALTFVVTVALFLGFSFHAQATDKQNLIYNFNRTSGGYGPGGTLVMDSSGNFYGAASEGNLSGFCCGTIFEMSPKPGGGWIYSVLYTFSGVGNDALPNGSLVRDATGNFYGTAISFGDGEVFELSPDGSGGWSETVLYTLGSSDGTGPSPVVRDGAGNLYGTTESGGAHDSGYVFEVSPASGGGWTFQHIHDFGGLDGSRPGAGVIVDGAGNLYGTTAAGGHSANCSSGCGVVFKLSQNSGQWTETIIHDFDGADGSDSLAPLTMDGAGNLYGSAAGGGPHGFGVIFELTLVSGKWQATTLYSFTDKGGDGAAPNSALVLRDGNLFGTTGSGGGGLGDCVSFGDPGCGSVFELSPSSKGWKETILFDFDGGTDGAFPNGVIFNSNGKAFGVAQGGGSSNAGVIYELLVPGK